MADYEDDDEMSESDDSPEEESDEYTQAAKEAFPNEDWTPERVDALRALISMCMEGPSAPKGKKGGTLIEMMFGHGGGSKD